MAGAEERVRVVLGRSNDAGSGSCHSTHSRERALFVAVLNAILGTLIAWVLVRDDFRGKRVVDALIDLPFALPTIVAGLVLLTLYGVNSPVGLELAYTRAGVVVALLFVTLPFVVRTVQPVLLELDVEMEQAAVSLGASKFTTFDESFSRTCCRQSRPAPRWRSPAPSANSARPC